MLACRVALSLITSGDSILQDFGVTNLVLAAVRFGLAGILLSGGFRCAPLNAQASAAPETVATRGTPSTPVPKPTPAQTASANPLPPAQAENWKYPAEHHPWARFPVGAWREIEVTTETFDEDNKIFGSSVTTQREILKAVAEDTYVIDVQATVDVSGKRIQGPWNTRVLRLATDRPGAIFSSTRQADHLLALPMGAVSCQVWEVRSSDESNNLMDRVYYSPEVYPHVLARNVIEQTENSPIEMAPLDAVVTLARSLPQNFEGRILECVSQQTVRRRDKGSSQIISVLSSEIPGGELTTQSTDFDSAGRRIRWSVQKLIGYGTSGGAGSIGGTGPTVETATDETADDTSTSRQK